MRSLFSILVLVPLLFLVGTESSARNLIDRPTYSVSANALPRPNLNQLEQVTELPEELPRRVMGLAYDGEQLWATIYLGLGRYATFSPSTHLWKLSERIEEHLAIRKVAGAFGSPGAICFANNKLWVAGAYGESFGSIDLQTWQVEHLFKGKYRDDPASQFYSSMACEGSNVWIAWHWFRYSLSRSQTELLLKVDPETGKVINQYALPSIDCGNSCCGTRNDGTHGLTWDGTQLWHMKDQTLSAIDPSSGAVTASFRLNQLKRPSGLAWDGDALWIAEFDGKIWRLPFEN